MTPKQAYSQWSQWGKEPWETESQAIQRFSRQFGTSEQQTQELLDAYPDRPEIRQGKKSGFMSQLFGAGTDELQKSFGSAIAGPGAELLEDAGFTGGARFLEDVGQDIVQQQEEDLRQYAAPQTREELIAEGGFMGALYENVLPEELQTPQQFARSALPSLGVAAVSSGAGLITGLATGNPFIGGATAMAVGNALGSFQVGGEEFENAKNDPYIREQLGISPEANFADLTPEQQRALTDSAQRVAKDTMVERLYTSGALESLAFIPYGSLALRYVADIGLGATSEELDKRLGMENTLEELERLGLPREQVPEMREKIAALRPGTFETILNAAVMEATFGAPTAIVETIVQPDARVDRRLTAENEKLKLLKARMDKAVADPEKLAKARLQVEQQQIKLEQLQEGLTQSKIKTADTARRAEEAAQPTITEPGLVDLVESSAQEQTGVGTAELAGESQQSTTTSRSQRAGGDAFDRVSIDESPIGATITETEGPGGRNLSLDKVLHQVALNEFNKVFPQIDFRPAVLERSATTGDLRVKFEDAKGNLRHDEDAAGVEGFVNDEDVLTDPDQNPIVYLTQSMIDENGALITNTQDALGRMTEVAFHEAVGHIGLRRMLNAGTMNEDQTWSGKEYNDFINNFDNRHAKMVDRWVNSNLAEYGNESRFRQVEEFIANNYGEKGGGKSLGFFENTAIAIREANPFIRNSLNQYQVAKTIREVVDRNVKISGKAPKKKNILTGAELVGTISRAATQANIEKDPEVTGEGEIFLRGPELPKKPEPEPEPVLQLEGRTQAQIDEEARVKKEKAEEDKRQKKLEPVFKKRAEALAKKEKGFKDFKKKLDAKLELSGRKRREIGKAEKRKVSEAEAIGDIMFDEKLHIEFNKDPERISRYIDSLKLNKTRRNLIAKRISARSQKAADSEFVEYLSPGRRTDLYTERVKLLAKKKNLNKTEQKMLAAAQDNLERISKGKKPILSFSRRGLGGYEANEGVRRVTMSMTGPVDVPAGLNPATYTATRPTTQQAGEKSEKFPEGKPRTAKADPAIDRREMDLRIPEGSVQEELMQGLRTAGLFYGKDEGAGVWRERSTEKMLQDELYDVRPREPNETKETYQSRVEAVKGSPFKVSEALDTALAGLTEQQREIIRLKTQPERLTQVDMAEQLGISPQQLSRSYLDAINKLYTDPGLQVAAQLQGYATQQSPKQKAVSERDQEQIDKLQANLRKGMSPSARVEVEDLLAEKGEVPKKFPSPRDKKAFFSRHPQLKPARKTKTSKSRRFAPDKKLKSQIEAINRQLVEGTIDKEQQTLLVNTVIGRPAPFKSLPTLPTVKQMKEALGEKWKKHFVIGDKGKNLKEGEEVSARLDIPAYTKQGVWVPTIHTPKGAVLAYGSTARLKDVQFNHNNLDSYIKSALSVATGEQAKFPFAMYRGKWVPQSPLAAKRDAMRAMNDPEWTQIGMNPTRHSFFYDRSDGNMNGMPVVSADEVIQIGGAMFAKNVVHGDMNDFSTTSYSPKIRYKTDKKTGKKVPISSKGFQEWVQAGRTAREGKLSFSKRGTPGKWASILNDFDQLTEEAIKSGRGRMIVYDSNLENEANVHSNLNKVTVGPKFFKASKEARRHILAHEFSHDLSDAMLADLTAFDLADMGAFGPKSKEDGTLTRGINGQFTPGENVAEIGAMITIGEKDDIQFLREKFPYALKYTTKRMLAEGYPVSDTAIDVLQEGEPTGTLSFSKRQLPMEVEMRKMQIERLPKGNPHRLNALRSLQKIYTLNPVGETFPTEYAEEINQAKPQISWSKRLTKEKAARLLRDGKIFTSPELVRQIMGDRPEHVNTVMRFLQKQRKRLLNKELTKRDVAKAYAMTVVSQGMAGSSPWKVWDVTGGTRKVPEFVGSGLSKREATLEEWVDAINRQHGREEITIQNAIDWYNKAPIWDTTYEWTGYRNKDGKFNKYQSAMSWETALESGDLKVGKTVLKSKPQIVKNKKGKYVLEADGKQFALNKVQVPLWFRDPGTSTEPDTTTGAFWVNQEYTDDRGFVRAEDGMAHWFATEDGQRALDAIEKGESFQKVKELWRPVLDIRLAMGDDRAGRALFKDLNAEKKAGNSKIWNEKKGGWQEYNFSNLDAYVQKINEAVDRHAGKPISERAEGVANDLVAPTQLFRNIDVGKEGFIKHMMGMGNAPTIDAIELNVWIAGFPDKSAKKSVLTGRPVAGTVRPELISWFNKLAKQKVPGKGNMTYMQLMKQRVKQQFDKVRKTDPESFKDIDPDIFYHVMHHWLWDRAKGLSANSLRGDIGNVQESFRPGVYQTMAPGAEALVLDRRDVMWDKTLDPGEAEPGSNSGMQKLDKKTKNLLSKSRRISRATIEDMQKNGFTHIAADRFATGTYQPLDPDNPYLKGYFMRGGVGYTLIPENQNAQAMWASDSVGINQGLINLLKKGVRHGLVYLMNPDSHLSNKAFWKIYEGETQWLIDKGELDTDRLEKRLQEIVDGKAAKWRDKKKKDGSVTQGLQGMMNDAKGDTLWEKVKNVIPATTFEQRKNLVVHLGGDVMATGNQDEVKAGIKKGFFSPIKQIKAVYGAPLQEIYPRVTQSPNADKYSVVAIAKFNDKFTDQVTGKERSIFDEGGNALGAENFGVSEHDAYQYILPGEDVAYFDQENSGVPLNQVFGDWLTGRKEEAQKQINEMAIDYKLPQEAIDALSTEGAPGKVKDKKDGDFVNKEWPQLSKQLAKRAKLMKMSKDDIEKLDNRLSAALNAMRATEVTDIYRAFSMSPVNTTVPDTVLGQFSEPTPDVTKLYISKSRRRATRSRSMGAVSQNLGRYGRYSDMVRRAISKIEPLSKLKDREKYMGERNIVFGKMARWEELGAFVYKTLKDSKQTAELYKYLTTEGQSSTIITNPEERKAAEKAKLKIQQIGQALVDRKLLKKKTLADFKAKYGSYLPRVYLQYLLNDDTRTKIANGARLKPSDLEYLKKRRDIPKGIRELVLGEVTTQKGAPAYLASRALQVPGKDMALLDFLAKIKDLSLTQGLNWVLPESVVEFNTLDEAKKIAKGMKGGDSVIRELEMDVDLSGLGQQVTPFWLLDEAKTLSEISEYMTGPKKKIVEGLALKMQRMGSKLTKVDIPSDYRKMPDSARYGQLRGMVVHRQIADDILGGFKLATGDESTMEKIFGDTGMMGRYNAYWKWAKVAANPPSWARNYVSNNILLNLAGIPMWRLPGLNASAWKDFKNKGKYYQIAVDQGLTKGNMSDAELGRMEKEFTDLQNKMKGGSRFGFMGAGVSALQKAYQGASDIYGSLETVGKMMAIKYAMEQKGMNEGEAAAFANKWLFDYGLVQPSVRYASTAVVGAPFVRFQSKVIPLMFEVALTKPWRLAPYYALGYGATELFKNNHDLDEEELDAMKQSLAEWLRQKAINGIMPPNVIPLPALDDQGRWQIWDASYVMPWGMISEFSSEFFDGEFVNAMKTLGLMGGPLPDMLAVLKTGVDPFTQRPITDDTKTFTEQGADYLSYFVNMSTPSMFNMEHGVLRRLWDAYSGALDPKTGEMKYTKFQANMRVIGMNIYPTDLVEQRRSNIRRMKWEMRNLQAAWTRKRRGLIKSGATREEIQEAREEYIERRNKMREDFRQYKRASVVPQTLKRAS